ncbi:hypothetical protein B4589_013000 [Halolamina sp. CBA1230]|uniref:hypothetical protein n=1 Tax=Halolamina sp. CBA1230 TaxID=1853690 RepID=UPI0009A1A34F|nr:hypothetical protein [Halolamina sp. CBA1230]QKY21244.1 hypothetical protein B4589_013000 [Halolamina sp. CBA1230]
MVLGLSGSQLFGAAMLVVGAVVLLVSARYVWRASGVVRAETVDSLSGTGSGSLVRLSGTAEPADEDALDAPFTGRESLVLRYAIEERRLSPVLLPWFVTIHERAGSVPFRLRTPESVVDVVEPTRTVTLATDRVATVGPDETAPERIERFERTTDALPSTTGWHARPPGLGAVMDILSLGARRYTEQRASPGDDVTVVGRVTDGGVDPLVVSDRSPAGTLRRMAGTSLVGVAIGVFVVAFGAVLLAI